MPTPPAAPTPLGRAARFVPPAIAAALALIWGSSFILMKHALGVFTPSQLGALRLFLAAMCLLPVLAATRRSIGRVPWLTIIAVGLLGNGIPAFLFAHAQTGLDSASAGVLNSLTPVFVVIIGAIAFRDPPGVAGTVGVLLGLAGAVILITSRSAGELRFDGMHAGLIVVATVCYGMTVNLVSHRLKSMKPLHITALALAVVGVPSGVWLAATGVETTLRQPGAPTAFGYVLLLAALGTAVSVVLFNHLIRIAGSLYATSVTYLIPVVALGWGVLDGEPVGPVHVAGLATILAGVWLANRKPAIAPPALEKAA